MFNSADLNIHLDTFSRFEMYPIVHRSVSLRLAEFVSLTKITGVFREELAVEMLLMTGSCARSPACDFSQERAWPSANVFSMLGFEWETLPIRCAVTDG